MTHKRLLFIQDDPTLGSIYQDRLELAGFTVETARDSETGLRIVDELKPDAVVMDLVLAKGDGAASVAQLRRRQPASHMPILLLPTAHAPLVNSALQAGATAMIERSGNPLSSIVAEVNSALGLASERQSTGTINTTIDPQWQYAALKTAPETLAAMRQTLHQILRSPAAGPLWRDLLRRIHAFAGQVSLMGENAISHVATATEVLVYGLECYPERINPTTLRTLGQAVDFLVTLWDREAHLQPFDLRDSHVLIVEDDPRARDLIIAAMNLVGLNADGLESPGESLAVLSSQPFDLIFMDVNLPEMNGFDVCSKIRALSLHERTPIVFLTGMTTFQNRAQSSLSGGNDFVGKPFNIAELGLKALIWMVKGRLGLS